MAQNQKNFNYTVNELFEIQVQKAPNHIALQDINGTYSYREINIKANQMAGWLKEKEIKSGDFVGVLLTPGVDFMISILAIIKAGAVYLPLDTLAPYQRLSEILNDAMPKLVITNEQYVFHLSESGYPVYLIEDINIAVASYSQINPTTYGSSISPLYMMYTSGSTGKPKGVIIPHRAVVNLILIDNSANISQQGNIAQFSNLAFDASTFEIWGALLHGITLVIIPYEDRTDPTKLAYHLKKYAIHYLFLPTGFFHQIIKSVPEALNAVKVIVIGGEQANHDLLKNFIIYRKRYALPITLINGYGPTEATAFTCRQIINEHSPLDDEYLSSIGKPIKNVKLYILDEHKNPASEGELYISGINLALGYHHTPDLNAEKFIPNPFCQEAPFQRLYKTGDKVRMLPSGDLLFLGRLDDQVKIGGFRIHLNEIENQLMKYSPISLAKVIVETGGGSHKILTAYVVSRTGEAMHADDIRQFLSLTLPPYMLPAKYILVKDLPLTPVGKVDKAKLSQMPHTDLSYYDNDVSSNSVEDTIKNIWLNLLNRRSIDKDKNLFDLGANSLLLVEACFRINEALHLDLQVSTLVSYPSIHKLCDYLEGNKHQGMKREKLSTSSGDIAIIGLSCRFPGSNSLDMFWDNLCQGKESLRRFTRDELEGNGKESTFDNEHFVPVRGILSDIDQFDASFFGFSPIDASLTDPQQRVFLECAWEALEDAGVVPSKVGSKMISVFAGMNDSSYLQENLLKNNWVRKEYDRFHQRMATSTGMLSTQVSYRLNLRGRSLNINTACSTGLVTVAEACQDLISHQSDIALAGAVSIVVPEIDGYIYQKGSIESIDGRCRPFSSEANGTVFSNGVGIVILKRLEDAIVEGDTIYAVIKGSGVNNDGSDKLGYIAPSTSGQMGCLSEALAAAKVSATDISYIEAHGTATALGDAVELDALKAIYSEETNKKQFCGLGSVKGNIGHADVAAGMAGLIKTVLCLYHEKIPPTLHCNKVNPDLKLDDSPFFITTELRDWKRDKKARYAGVSAFGVGGTNAHLILKEPPEASVSSNPSIHEQVFIFSAKTEKSLLEFKEKMIHYLELSSEEKPIHRLADIAYTLQTRREAFAWRSYAVGKNTRELMEHLGKSSLGSMQEVQPRMVFMFPGQGSQYHAMASPLMEIPYFASLVNEGIRLAKPYLHCDLQDILNNRLDTRIHQTEYAQPALFIIEFALAKLLMHWGIMPKAFIGHSLGEYVAACLAEVFSFEDAIKLVCQRGLLMGSAPKGEMLAIECTLEAFNIYTAKTGVELALHNAVHHCVASGSREAIAKLEQELKRHDISFQKLKVSHAFHSQWMDTIEQPFKALFSTISLSSPKIPILSNVTGDWLTESEATDPDYWYRHLRNTVQLCQGFKRLLTNESSLFVEVGTGETLSTFLKDTAKPEKIEVKTVTTLPNHKGKGSDVQILLNAIGQLWQQGVSIRWALLHNHENRRHVPLPTYCFQRQRYWIEPDSKHIDSPDPTPKLYIPVWYRRHTHKQPISLGRAKLSEHCWIIFNDELGLGENLIRLLEDNHVNPIVVTHKNTYSENNPRSFSINLNNKNDYIKFFQSIKNIIRNPIILHLPSYANMDSFTPSIEEINDQLVLGFYSLLFLTQAYIEQIGTSLKIGVITTGTHQILGTEKINPVHATLNGACRVIMQEHETLKLKLIDLDSNEHPQNNVNLLSNIINSCLNDEWDEASLIKPYRNGYQWQQMYHVVKSQQKKIRRLKDKGIYLLTGGIGGIALSCCEAISKTISNPTFILLSRRKMPLEIEWEGILQNPNHPYYEKIKQIHQMQGSGASFLFYQVDISQFILLDDVICQCISKFGTIDGLIHTAGVLKADLVEDKTRETAEETFLPKIHGTYNLIRSLKNVALDFVILNSSLAALIGGFRQVDYSAANACLDAFANSDLFSYPFVVSINWNTWRDVGIAAEALSRGEPTFIGKGNDISSHQGQELFLNILQNNESHLAVSNAEINFDTVVPVLKDLDILLPNIIIPRQDLNIITNYLPATNETESKLIALWQKELGIEKIGINDDFFALGGHSLKALTIIEKINKIFECELPATQIYRDSTIKNLSSAIINSSKKQRSNTPILLLNEIQEEPPYIFLCHPISGLINCFYPLVSQSDLPISIYGIQDPNINVNKVSYDSLDAMAEDYVSFIQKNQPIGPYFLIGYSFGGNLLYEVANKLQKKGHKIGLLALIDSWTETPLHLQNEASFKRYFELTDSALPNEIISLAWEREQLLLAHLPSITNQEMLLFKASDPCEVYKPMNDSTNGWSKYNKGKILCHVIKGTHETIINDEGSKNILHLIKQHLNIKHRKLNETIQECTD